MEFAFELSLAATLEDKRRVVSRQLGGHVHGRRIVDLVCLEPGPEFDERAALTSKTIPPTAIESDIGPGRARYWKAAFDCHPERAATAIERALEIGFFEAQRRNGRQYLRQVTRYPDWFDRLVAIENKPDLDRPGDLLRQLQTDVSLGIFDAVVLATNSYVTGAHRNRIPEAVGIWQYDPDSGDRSVLREPTSLAVDEAGIERVDDHSDRTEIRVVTPTEKSRARRRIAERAYGKGWRTFGCPDCSAFAPTDAGLPRCRYYDRIVRPATECGPKCDGHDPETTSPIDVRDIRASRSAWSQTTGRDRRQTRIDRYGSDPR